MVDGAGSPGPTRGHVCPEDWLDPGKSVTLTVHGKEMTRRREEVPFWARAVSEEPRSSGLQHITPFNPGHSSQGRQHRSLEDRITTNRMPLARQEHSLLISSRILSQVKYNQIFWVFKEKQTEIPSLENLLGV